MPNHLRVRRLFALGGLLAAAAYAAVLFQGLDAPAPYVATNPSTIASVPEASPGVADAAHRQAPGTLAAADPVAWDAAIARVQERRGSSEPLAVPEALRHADDRRRFLAVQLADSNLERYDLPHDQADLAQMILRGEMAELSPLGRDHILYEIGTDARENALAHYDAASGKDIPLFPSLEAYAEEDARLAVLASGKGRTAAQARDRRELLASFYGRPEIRDGLFQEHEAITSLAANFGGSTYDLEVPADRARFQARLLSFVRPEARDAILELARAYQERFDRLLPVTSAVRTQRYQRRLSGVNSNAARVDIPPHTTGMAFDVSYKFMASDEQNFVMEHLARMEAEGRVEALRERRNHLHVYTFADGRPSETALAGFLDDVEAAHPTSAPGYRAKKASPRKPGIKRAAARSKAPVTRKRSGTRTRRAR